MYNVIVAPAVCSTSPRKRGEGATEIATRSVNYSWHKLTLIVNSF